MVGVRKSRRKRAAEPAGGFGALAEIEDFGDNPGNLRMKGHAPAGLQPGAALVVALHGCAQTADDHERGAGWATLAERHGFALLCPEQRRRNNPQRCFNWFSPISRGAAECASIRAMIERAVEVYGIDRTRVYLVGLSAGGCLAGQLLATYPEVFAAGAVIAGVPYGGARTVMEALSVMHRASVRDAEVWGDEVRNAADAGGPWPRVSVFHGAGDETVDPANAEEVVKQWANVHGLALETGEAQNTSGYSHTLWKTPEGEILLERVLIADMAHGEPVRASNGLGQPEPYFIEAPISAVAYLAKSWGLTAHTQAMPLEAPAAPPPKRTILHRLGLKTSRT